MLSTISDTEEFNDYLLKEKEKKKNGAGLFRVVETQTSHFSTPPTIIMERLM